MSPGQQALDGALVAVISTALHQRCSGLQGIDHRADDHDHGALDVVAALREQGWICTHARTPGGDPPRA